MRSFFGGWRFRARRVDRVDAFPYLVRRVALVSHHYLYDKQAKPWNFIKVRWWNVERGEKQGRPIPHRSGSFRRIANQRPRHVSLLPAPIRNQWLGWLHFHFFKKKEEKLKFNPPVRRKLDSHCFPIGGRRAVHLIAMQVHVFRTCPLEMLPEFLMIMNFDIGSHAVTDWQPTISHPPVRFKSFFFSTNEWRNNI